MKFNLATGLLCLLATSEVVAATSWWNKAVYNKWHETELERWLSDHDIPYPTPADRRDLENLVKSNWEARVQKPLGNAVDRVSEEVHDAKEWVFDTWTESQLKSFLDRHGIPAPQPRHRDSLIKAARENYESIAKKTGETAAYPGNWLYENWSESDLKQWLDERGWPAPQPTSRDKLIASVRRNSRLASLQAQSISASASASAAAAQASLSEELFNAWSDSQLKKFLDEHDVKVPQGSKRNELVALARKHRAYLVNQASSAASSASSTASNAFEAATTKAGNEFAKATDDIKLKIDDQFNDAINTWSESRLKAFLDARGVPVPQSGKRDELVAKVRSSAHRAAGGWTVNNFDTWDKEHLIKYLSAQGEKVEKKTEASRDQLLKQARNSYAKASKAGGGQYASATKNIAEATGTAKQATFDNWSESDLKSFLDSYGIPVYQGSNINELRAAARRQATFFSYGTTTPQETIYAKMMENVNWILEKLKMGASSGRAQGQEAAEKAREKAAEQTEKVRNEL
ncbi:Uncharacterized protein PECH_006824 [Penicillium ucsense]|uniref:Uncharacterized protein n=1 Tax=Penicillium ucsense TaxID=2839758 RepID=A0A8J8VWK7_9EURO|nr:Uncharacterized protein PECM_002979 [Penicillium ucsense]KAF7735309.1 Uncharacterized protein PECH_006824 [Penicillium ucsense]